MTKPKLISPDFTLYEGNCIEILKELPDKSIDVVCADPPYFLSNGGSTCSNGKRELVDKGKWDKSAGVQNDYEFNKKWITECQRVMKDDATAWIFGTHHNIYSVGFILQQLGFKILNHIVWQKTCPPPNLSCRLFTHESETIIWAAKSKKSKYCFNYQDMKKENGGKQMKSIWTFGPPRKKEKEFGKYKAQKPVKLIERIVLSSTDVGALILDPFMGSGTTMVASLGNDRKCIGIDKEKDAIRITQQRFSNL